MLKDNIIVCLSEAINSMIIYENAHDILQSGKKAEYETTCVKLLSYTPKFKEKTWVRDKPRC